MKEIRLGNSGLIALLDDEDAYLANFYWHAKRRGKIWYVRRNRLRAEADGPWDIWMHRSVMRAPVGVFIDHINGDGLDNRRANLRFCSIAENTRNAIQKVTSRWTYKGIEARGGTFYATIKVGGRRYFLGTFNTEEAAARAYDEAARHYHGAFARLNFPQDGEQSALPPLPANNGKEAYQWTTGTMPGAGAGA